jgi:SAM-dependent methyltransferase
MLAPANLVEHYVCSQCGGRLRLSGEVLVCTADELRYPVRNGIPDFSRLAARESPGDVHRLERLNELARELGWRMALETVFSDEPHLIRYVTDPKRLVAVDLLPLHPTSRVLEVGSGLGQFAARLASRAAFVDGLEVVAGQASFAAERTRQDGVRNVAFACGGDDCRLPYANETFDVVLASLVLEWCATRGVEQVQAMQLRLLGEIRRVLKLGGCLFLTTKNRFGLRYLLGGRDEHFGMRFGSALPRALLRLHLGAKGVPIPRVRLYSYSGLRRMITSAGFDVHRSYWATPDLRFVEEYVPNDPGSVRQAIETAAFAQAWSRRSRLLMRYVPPALVKHFTAGLAFLALAAPAPNPPSE